MDFGSSTRSRVRGVDYLVAPREAMTTQKASAPQYDSRKSHLIRAALHPPPGILKLPAKSCSNPNTSASTNVCILENQSCKLAAQTVGDN